MPRYDVRGELAPRDVVARALQGEMAARGDTHALLDISHKPRAAVLEHFPNVAAHCAALGVDITQVGVCAWGVRGGRVGGCGGGNIKMLLAVVSVCQC